MSHAPSAALKHRQQAVRHALTVERLDALVVTSLPNVLYLTNFTGSAGIVVLTGDRLVFVTDSRYVTAVQSTRGNVDECVGLELAVVESSYDATLAAILEGLPGDRVGFEAAHLTVARHRWLASAVGPQRASGLMPTEGIVERGRVRKDAYEIATLREAARRLSSVAVGVMTEVRVGRTEQEVAQSVDRRIREAFARPAFDTIVAAGPNAALPHAHPGERKLTEGDLVVLDFGGVYDSYCVDLTRTVSIGPANGRTREVYGAVLDAHDRAVASVKPGVSRFAIDEAARGALGRHGLAHAFGHGTGHGLGIEVHEDPRIAQRRSGTPGVSESEEVAPGMVFTIEPGAYLPGWGGVRIEDDVLVTANGVEVLTDVTTELLEL
jgi:Xaa-Pro aminopeptidase